MTKLIKRVEDSVTPHTTHIAPCTHCFEMIEWKVDGNSLSADCPHCGTHCTGRIIPKTSVTKEFIADMVMKLRLNGFHTEAEIEKIRESLEAMQTNKTK